MTPRAQRRLFFLLETRAAFGPNSAPRLQPKRQPQHRGANHPSSYASRRIRRRHHHRVTCRQCPVCAPPSSCHILRRAMAEYPAQKTPARVKRTTKRAPRSAARAAPSTHVLIAAAQQPHHMRSIQGHHCRTALQEYAPKRRRRYRNCTPIRMTPRAQRSLFFLMETRAAFGPDSVPSLRSKRQPKQRCADHRKAAASGRTRRTPHRAHTHSRLHPTARAVRHAPTGAVPARLCIRLPQSGAANAATTSHSRCKSTSSAALAYSWRRVRHLDPTAHAARCQSGSPISAAPTTPAVMLPGARAGCNITGPHAANARLVHRAAVSAY